MGAPPTAKARSSRSPRASCGACASPTSPRASSGSPPRSLGLGVRPGDRVATFLWNSQEHLEAYLAVPSMGAVLHTLNIRLAPAEVAYIIGHAARQASCSSTPISVPVLARALPELKHRVERFIVVGDGDAARARRRRARLRGAPRRLAGGARLRCLARRSTRARRRPCATRAAPPGSPRASSTATARPGCTRWRSAWAPRSASAERDTRLADRPHVPRQRLGPALRGVDVGRRPGAAGALRQRRRHLPRSSPTRAPTVVAGVPTVFRDHARARRDRRRSICRRCAASCAAARPCPSRSSRASTSATACPSSRAGA